MTAVDQLFTMQERLALTPPPDLTVSAWAERFRMMSSLSSPRRGKWDASFNPYVRDIMDARSDPRCRVAIPVLPTQSGKSEAMLNMVAWGADIAADPTIVVQPTTVTRRYFMLRRLLPMFQETPRLRRLLTGLARDETITELQLLHTVIYTATGHSPSEAASKPAGAAFLDEVDRYPTIISTKEGSSAVDLVLERLRAWGKESFAYISSTPTTRNGIVWSHLESSDFRQFHVACPSCRDWFVPSFDQVRPRGVASWSGIEPLDVVRRNLASHHCPKCGEEIPDGARPRMIREGVWVPRECAIREDGSVNGSLDASVRGWHAEALICINESPANMVADFLSARAKTNGLQRFVNLRRAMVWEDKVESPEVERVFALRLPYEKGRVPDPVVFLTAGVDVQKYGFYFVVRGWAPSGHSYLIDQAYVESWAAVLRAVVRAKYQTTDGAREYQVARALLDSSEGIRTEEIYRVARDYPDVLGAAKGQRSLIGYQTKTVTLRSSKTEIGEGLPLTHVNTGWAKDKISGSIAGGGFHVHREIDDQYAQQLCSEHKVRKVTQTGEKTVWEKKQGQRQNHYLDCEVLALSAASMAGLDDLDSSAVDEFEGEQKQASKPRPVRDDNDDDDWLRSPAEWIDG